MNAYSLDLRKKIVEAKERGMPTVEVARTFGVGVSTVKRYAATAREGKPLAPKKRPGSKPMLDEAGRKLLEADLEERPAATLPQRREFLTRVAGVRVSDSTVSRMLGGLWSREPRMQAASCSSRSARRMSRCVRCTLGRGGASGRFARHRATGGRTSPCSLA